MIDGQSRTCLDTDIDLDKLIEKTEIEGEKDDVAKESGLQFSFAKVWAADKDAFEDIGDDAQDVAQDDSWAQALERIAATKNVAQEKEVMGRGVRRKAAATFPQVGFWFFRDMTGPLTPFQQELGYIEGLEDTPRARKSNSKNKHRPPKFGTSSDSDVYAESAPGDDTDSSMNMDPALLLKLEKRDLHQRESDTQMQSQSTVRDDVCGLCDEVHGPGACAMTDDAANLVEYRKILLRSDAEPEPARVSRSLTLRRIAFIETQEAAIDAIDEELRRRGQWHLIFDQPRKKAKLTSKRVPEPQPKQWNLQVNEYRSSAPSVPTNHKGTPRFVQQTGEKPNMPPSVPPSHDTIRFKQPTSKKIPPPPPMLPSKRLTPPHPQASSSKKHKQNGSPNCAICSGPWHIIKACPLVAGATTERYETCVRLDMSVITPLLASRSCSCGFLVT